MNSNDHNVFACGMYESIPEKHAVRPIVEKEDEGKRTRASRNYQVSNLGNDDSESEFHKQTSSPRKYGRHLGPQESMGDRMDIGSLKSESKEPEGPVSQLTPTKVEHRFGSLADDGDDYGTWEMGSKDVHRQA